MSEFERIIKSGLPPRSNFDNIVLGWKIFYSNGDIFTSLDGTWIEAPSLGVTIVLIYYKQTYPIFINNIKENHHYREVFDEGKYFWYRLIDGIPTYGQCEATDLSMPVNPIAGEIKVWDVNNFQQIYNQAYLDKW